MKKLYNIFMKEVFGAINSIFTDKELSNLLRITERTLYNWKKKETIDKPILIDIYEFIKNNPVLNKRVLTLSLEKDIENFQDVYKNIILRGRTSVRNASIRILNGESWKIPFFDFVDSFKNTGRPEIINKPPVDCLEPKIEALFASATCKMCNEIGVEVPQWASVKRKLKKPWFISEMKKLQEIELLESPLEFKRNNLFCTSNFLHRV